ncbi:MAG TPA: DNA-3-methyladenine glycosylase 2 [Ohtaekwangia sp.]|nr:DNA-3-methyladenine glycosylase 2 [Ohtaekwangia sp.]
MINAVIPLPEDYNVAFNFQFLRRSPKELLHVIEGDAVLKLFIINNAKYLVKIIPGNGVFTITFPALQPDEATQASISSYIKEWFDLTSDLGPFYKIASRDKLLAPLVKRFYGYRIVGQPDLFESLVWAVIGQQINLQFAYTLKQRFVAAYGTILQWNDRSYYAFPVPEVVVTLRDEDLLPLQFSRQKSKYVQLIAQAFVDGRISKLKLSSLPFEEAKEQLIKIKGVGNWTANYALMKTFRYPDAFPLEDAGIHNAIKNLKKMNRKPTLDEVKHVFKKYKGWEAYATLYLWKSLELPQ